MNYTVPTDAALGVALGAFIIGCFLGWLFGNRQRNEDAGGEFARLYDENEELKVKIYNELLRRKWARLKTFPHRCPYRTQSQSDNTGDTCNADTPPECQKTPDPDP